MADTRTFYCDKCKKTMRADQFYGSNNTEKYPEGKLKICKQCMTLRVDNWDPETYMWILQECDVPYIPEEWNKLMLSYAKDRSKVTGTTIIGRYLSKMKLAQFKQYRWQDSEFLQDMANKKTEETMKRQGYSAAEIATVLSGQQLTMPDKPLEMPDLTPEPAVFGYESAIPQQEDYFTEQLGIDIDLGADLTDEDKRYLLIKWGKAYKPEEWVKLEQLYKEMEESYDIQGAGHEDILKLVCKTSLKANQLLDIGDVDAAQKMVKMYDGLMKSGKFTAAQNKAENGEYLDSIGELVVICEKEGFIPRYYTGGPNDRVDETLMDLKNYTHSLVVDEMNLGNLIENAVKQMVEQESKEEDEDVEEELEYDNLDELKDEDFADFGEFIEEEELSDEELMRHLKEGS